VQTSRRQAIQLLAGAGAALASRPAFGQRIELPERIAAGPFQGTRDSLAAYEIPEWFRDAKFGIWAHWGPQSAPEDGDWYARRMYIQGDSTYKFHVDRYGHPSKFGFKDVVPTWKGDQFDPERLIGLYKKAGAKYFVSMGVHHDNFDLWNSKHQRWNAVNMGPKKDIVGLWRNAARAAGLRFGVSEHLWISYKWFAVNRWSDQTGPLAGVPYDGANPEFQDLYHNVDLRSLPALPKLEWSDANIPESFKRHWYSRIKDLVDSYEPDLLYTDGALPFEDYGLSLVAHHYNLSASRHGGRTQAVYNSKRQEDCAAGTCVLDVVSGPPPGRPTPAWATGTIRKGFSINRPRP
jgi:alpha-L-fucosidase